MSPKSHLRVKMGAQLCMSRGQVTLEGSWSVFHLRKMLCVFPVKRRFAQSWDGLPARDISEGNADLAWEGSLRIRKSLP